MFLQTKNGNFEFRKKFVIFKMIEKTLSVYFVVNEIDVGNNVGQFGIFVFEN